MRTLIKVIAVATAAYTLYRAVEELLDTELGARIKNQVLDGAGQAKDFVVENAPDLGGVKDSVTDVVSDVITKAEAYAKPYMGSATKTVNAATDAVKDEIKKVK